MVNRSDIMRLREKCTVYGSYCPQKVAGNGAPKFDRPKLLLQNLKEEGFAFAEMSKIICVSERTLFRRLSEYNLTTTAFADIPDAELDTHKLQVCSIDCYFLLLVIFCWPRQMV